MAAARLTVLALGMFLFSACASRQAAKVPAAAAPGGPGAGPGSTYLVRKGDSLWKIASMPQIMSDPFRWPLLYKQNRDQIADPDLIEVRQDLSYRREFSQAEIAEALRLARETPPYVPHSAPRKSLPLKY